MESASHYGLSPCEMAAKYTYKFIQNHCFRDGNKRVGVTLGVSYIRMLRGTVTASDQDLIDLGLGVAKSEMSESDVLAWFEARVHWPGSEPVV